MKKDQHVPLDDRGVTLLTMKKKPGGAVVLEIHVGGDPNNGAWIRLTRRGVRRLIQMLESLEKP